MFNVLSISFFEILKVRWLEADLNDLAQVEHLAAKIQAISPGGIDVLINNAGVFDPSETTSVQVRNKI